MSQSCETCGREFSRKEGLEKHRGNKKPCKAPTRLIQAALAEAGVAPQEPEPTTEFRDNSKKFNASLTKEVRAEHGIYFTPKKARDALFAALNTLGVAPTRILEPSFGTGEFLLDARHKYPDAELVGVEMNKDLYKSVQCATKCSLANTDFLRWVDVARADLIIGNPPYFVMDRKVTEPCMTGRPNIYVLFLYKCLEQHLATDGHLAFIIPTSLYNCSYYQPMRDYIKANTTIRHLENLDRPGFFETGQDTMLIVIQKKKVNDDYIFTTKTGTTYITPFYKELNALTEGAKNLRELGLGVKTGNVVWNQVKEKLADSGTLLIYSSNINNCELKIGNLGGKERKQYVKGIEKPTVDGPVILVERGYGNSFRFNSVLVNEKGFYAENHVNVIYPKTSVAVENLGRVIESFRDERSMRFVKWFVGNGSLSATELESIMPIF
jgi:adenine-specific DNA-methyltransferase